MEDTETDIFWPEPAPNWPRAKLVWQVGWPLHVYSFASLNLVVAVYALYVLLKHRGSHRKLHAVFINAMLVLFGSLRAVFLISDPYASREHETKAGLIASVVAYGVATALLTSSLTLLLLLLLETTRISLAPSKVQNLRFLLGVTLLNVLYVLVADIIVVNEPQTRVLILICQIGFAIWGIAVSVSFAVVAYRVWRNLSSSREAAHFNQQIAEETQKTRRLVSLMYLASFCTFAKFVLVIYAAISESMTFKKTGELDSWTWLALQTALRALELISCSFIFVVALRVKKSQDQVTNMEMTASRTAEVGVSPERAS